MDKLSYLQQCDLFNSLTPEQLRKVADITQEYAFKADDIIIKEHEISDMVYVLKMGEVKVTKFDAEFGTELSIATLDEGTVLGELSLLDELPRSATIRAVTDSTLYGISFHQLKQLSNQEHSSFLNRMSDFVKTADSRQSSIYTVILKNLSKSIVQRIRDTNASVIEGMKEQLRQNRVRVAMGHLIINTLIFLIFYMWTIQILIRFKNSLPTTSVISIPCLILLGIAVFIMMKNSGYPISLYGVTLKDWRASLYESIIASVVLAVLCVLYKFYLIHFQPHFIGRSVFAMQFTTTGHQISLWLGVGLVIAYTVFVPIQELIVRGALQSSFYEFFLGKYKRFWSIVLPNLLFSITHLHLSLAATALVLFPGFVWGWLYSRHRTLVGVIFSHFVLGIWALFIVGVI